MHDPKYKSFYDERRAEMYAHDYFSLRAEDSTYFATLQRFIHDYGLEKKKCLEIGSSGGMFQDMVPDYYGTDIAESLAQYYHKPYRVAEGTTYPFDDEMFDAIWTFAVYEHIPHLQEALKEIVRMLRPGGVVLFQPAWQCRPWKAEGYAVRPYSDFRIRGRLIKASIPLRNSLLWRSLLIFPKRLYRHCRFLLGTRYTEIRYRRLTPNYDVFWSSDADACNHIDPHDAILWFASHNFECLTHPMHLKAFLVRTGGLVFRKIPE
jgi:SAM-dependent methyltransferase